MSSKTGIQGHFKPPESQQSQTSPGLEASMLPPSESTKLEGPGEFIEYVPSGKLKDKKVIITGGDSGIGRSVAVLMAKEGADITIVYLPEEQVDAETTKRMIEAEQRACNLFVGDLIDTEACRKAIDSHVKRFGRINVLINNAAQQSMCKDFMEIDLNTADRLLKSNVLQVFAMTKYALPHMSRGDSIINTSSITAFRGSNSMVEYSATKGAIISFTRSLAQSLISKGIRVNAVAPGAIYTPIQVITRPAEQMQGWYSQSVMGRPGQPSEVAPSFVFLASAEAALYYGQILLPYPLGE